MITISMPIIAYVVVPPLGPPLPANAVSGSAAANDVARKKTREFMIPPLLLLPMKTTIVEHVGLFPTSKPAVRVRDHPADRPENLVGDDAPSVWQP
jgi:hypothetical protein